MIEKTKLKRAGGRPPKPPEEKLKQFSIRLPAKLKFGLELLARAQGRSLSQAVEWALQRGVNTFEVTHGRHLGIAVDAAWETRHNRFNMLEAVFHIAPEALDLQDRWFVRTVLLSWEHARVQKVASDLGGKNSGAQQRHYRELKSKLDSWVDRQFDELKRAIDEISLQGESIEGRKLTDLLGLPPIVGDIGLELSALVDGRPRA